MDVVLYNKKKPPRAGTRDGARRGAVRDRSQTFNPHNGHWVKRGPGGRFMDQKADGDPFKGVRKER